MKRIMLKQIAQGICGEPVCASGLRLFRKRWPNGFPPTPDNIAVLVGLEIRQPIPWALGGCRVFGAAAWRDCETVIRNLVASSYDYYWDDPVACGEAAIALVLALEDWEYDKEN